MSLGELAGTDTVGKAGKSIEDRHRAGQLTVSASSVGPQHCRNLDKILCVDKVIDPLREADAFIELGELGQHFRLGLGRSFYLSASEVGVIRHNSLRRLCGVEAGALFGLSGSAVEGFCDRFATEGFGALGNREVLADEYLFEYD